MAAQPPERSPVSTLASGPIAALATVVLVLVGLLALREVASFVVPVLFGLFLALVAWPVVEALERRGARHPVALTGAILVVLVIVLATAAIAVFSIAELVLQVPKYADRFQSQLDELIAYLATFGVTLDPAAITSVISADRIVSVVRPVASGLSSAGIAIFVLVVTMIYALFGGSSLAGRAREAFGAEHGLLSGMDRFGNDLRRYLLVRAELGLFAAVLSFVLLLVLGVPFPALWAFLVFAASFIPNLGTFLAVLPPTVMAFLAVGVPQAIIVVVGYTLINFAQDHFLQPVLMGSELNLSPLVVFLSVLLWAWVLGPAGALLAVPITVGIVAIMESHPSTARIAALLRNSVEHGPPIDGPPDLSPAATGDAVPPSA